MLKHWFWRVGLAITDGFSLFADVLELHPHEKRGTSILWISADDKGAQIFGTSPPGRLRFVRWRVISVGPRLDVRHRPGVWIFEVAPRLLEKFVHPCVMRSGSKTGVPVI
jgi:hypothetical protein